MSDILTPNFSKMSLNLSKMQLPVFNPTAPATQPVTQVVTQPVATQVMNLPVPETKTTTFEPINFIFDLDNIDTSKLENTTTQEQQYKSAKFSFKVPRIKAALIEETVDKQLVRAMAEIEKGRQKPGSVQFTPLNRMSEETQKVIAHAQAEYNATVDYRKDSVKGGVKQHEKELKAWNEMKDEKGNLIPAFTKVLRDVFTLDFKTEADVVRFAGDPDNKVDGLLKTWSREHKKNQDKLAIRTQRTGNQVVLTIVFNKTPSTTDPLKTISDEMVANFNSWFATVGAGVSCKYERVLGEYKTKMVKDKKTGKMMAQDKKKPSDYVIDSIVGMDPWKAALVMINKLRNRFSDELHVGVTVFIDYLVRQFAELAIVKCHQSEKKRVHVHHVLENANLIELFPLISNFKCYKEAVARHALNSTKTKLNGTTVGNSEDDEAEEKEKSGKHRFEYCVVGVCKLLIKELAELNPNDKFKRSLISAEFKQFMCSIIDELIATFGPILRQEITNQKIKTVNIETFYSVLGVRLTWDRINFPNIRSYIEERVNLFNKYEDPEEDSALQA